ncbi:hypothetical protein J3A78_003858 [Streptomyces sp. PvR006]|uniref:DUF6221 family protein n=1 Tax=Streptomyces sp. PvR006 TaxID=2817860 RepID=UPI001AEB6863|nr:DUF6221 family protein [Streptomyces sp. PvR006]MBP2583380.1 hypothetical protein [Streptomyces sp. PvR006]
MADLIAFLSARLDEDAAAARRAGDSFRQIGETGVIVATEGDRAEECASANWAGIADHIVRHDPARVLAEVNAKRRIVTAYENYDNDAPELDVPESVLRLLALPYADHPDYRPEWAPTT